MDDAVGQGRFAVVDMSDDGKIADVVLHGAVFNLTKRKRGTASVPTKINQRIEF
jgi:hypothetical protein